MYQKCYILGTPYEVVSEEEVKKTCKLEDNDGLAELYSKQLVVNLSHMNEPTSFDNIDAYYKKVLRHEMIHAFFHECGLTDYCSNEELVDFLALQLDKMWEIMNPEALTDYLKNLGFYSRKGE